MPSPAGDALPVLLVDDDRFMLQTLSDILRMRGYGVETASTGQAAMDLARQMDGPAIALVDLRLPDVDGIELMTRLHAVSELTEIVILTGNASLDTAVRALQQQSFDYLIKPVDPERLLNTIDRASERWRRKYAETALRESEERLRRMFQAISDAVFITDEHARIVDANEAAVELSGYTADELKQRSLNELLRELPNRYGDPRLVSGTRPLGSGEYLLVTRSGESVVSEMRTSEFAPGRHVHTLRDLTERRRLEHQLLRAQRMEAVGQLAGGLAHDFNNVLTAITGFAQLISEMEQDPEKTEYLSEIVDAANRGARLIQQLLAFSRKQVLSPRVLDLNDVISRLKVMLRRLVREDVELVLDLDPTIGNVRADGGQLEQVLINLALNSVDAMPNGGRITIQTFEVHLDEDLVRRNAYDVVPGGYVALSVSDTGHGMDQETATRVFEPFFTTKAPEKGTGLGLATVYGIVKQSSGHISVETAPGKGSTFTIYLPRVEEPPEAGADDGIGRAASLDGSETVLLVEDDPMVRALVRRALEMHGYVVIDAGDASTALAHIDGDRPIHLLLTDVIMPELNGAELAAAFRRRRPDAGVLFISGYMRDVAQKIEEFEGGEFLEKPFTVEALLRTVRSVLDRSAKGLSASAPG